MPVAAISGGSTQVVYETDLDSCGAQRRLSVACTLTYTGLGKGTVSGQGCWCEGENCTVPPTPTPTPRPATGGGEAAGEGLSSGGVGGREEISTTPLKEKKESKLPVLIENIDPNKEDVCKVLSMVKDDVGITKVSNIGVGKEKQRDRSVTTLYFEFSLNLPYGVLEKCKTSDIELLKFTDLSFNTEILENLYWNIKRVGNNDGFQVVLLGNSEIEKLRESIMETGGAGGKGFGLSLTLCEDPNIQYFHDGRSTVVCGGNNIEITIPVTKTSSSGVPLFEVLFDFLKTLRFLPQPTYYNISEMDCSEIAKKIVPDIEIIDYEVFPTRNEVLLIFNKDSNLENMLQKGCLKVNNILDIYGQSGGAIINPPTLLPRQTVRRNTLTLYFREKDVFPIFLSNWFKKSFIENTNSELIVELKYCPTVKLGRSNELFCENNNWQKRKLSEESIGKIKEAFKYLITKKIITSQECKGSLDGYGEIEKLSDGSFTQKIFLYKFAGDERQPSYTASSLVPCIVKKNGKNFVKIQGKFYEYDKNSKKYILKDNTLKLEIKHRQIGGKDEYFLEISPTKYIIGSLKGFKGIYKLCTSIDYSKDPPVCSNPTKKEFNFDWDVDEKLYDSFKKAYIGVTYDFTISVNNCKDIFPNNLRLYISPKPSSWNKDYVEFGNDCPLRLSFTPQDFFGNNNTSQEKELSFILKEVWKGFNRKTENPVEISVLESEKKQKVYKNEFVNAPLDFSLNTVKNAKVTLGTYFDKDGDLRIDVDDPYLPVYYLVIFNRNVDNYDFVYFDLRNTQAPETIDLVNTLGTVFFPKSLEVISQIFEAYIAAGKPLDVVLETVETLGGVKTVDLSKSNPKVEFLFPRMCTSGANLLIRCSENGEVSYDVGSGLVVRSYCTDNTVYDNFVNDPYGGNTPFPQCTSLMCIADLALPNPPLSRDYLSISEPDITDAKGKIIVKEENIQCRLEEKPGVYLVLQNLLGDIVRVYLNVRKEAFGVDPAYIIKGAQGRGKDRHYELQPYTQKYGALYEVSTAPRVATCSDKYHFEEIELPNGEKKSYICIEREKNGGKEAKLITFPRTEYTCGADGKLYLYVVVDENSFSGAVAGSCSEILNQY
ncbi:hypothetical protein [Persephonella sp.]